jgi:hypothetical protein
MSKVNSFAYGEVSGKFGNTVGAVDRRGKTTMKEYRAPSNPNTKGQVSQRTKFGFINTELSFMRRMFKTTYVSYITREDLKKASWMAVKNSVTGTSPDFTIDYTKLIIAKGSLPWVGQVSVTLSNNGTVDVTWDTTLFLGVDPTDSVKIIFANPLDKSWLLSEENAMRTEGAMTVTLPQAWVGIKVHCWVYAISSTGKTTSMSQYVSELQL